MGQRQQALPQLRFLLAVVGGNPVVAGVEQIPGLDPIQRLADTPVELRGFAIALPDLIPFALPGTSSAALIIPSRSGSRLKRCLQSAVKPVQGPAGPL